MIEQVRIVLGSILILTYAGLSLVDLCRKDFNLSAISFLLLLLNYLMFFRR